MIMYNMLRIWRRLWTDEKTDGADRISELPTNIIHDIMIMSRMPTKEVAETCSLSKRWNLVQKSYAILDFDITDFIGTALDPKY